MKTDIKRNSPNPEGGEDKKDQSRHRSWTSNIKADTAKQEKLPYSHNRAGECESWERKGKARARMKFKILSRNRFFISPQATHAARMLIRLKWRNTVCFGLSFLPLFFRAPSPSASFSFSPPPSKRHLIAHLRLRYHNFLGRKEKTEKFRNLYFFFFRLRRGLILLFGDKFILYPLWGTVWKLGDEDGI